MRDLRIFTGRKIRKKILCFSYRSEEIYKAERRDALRFYRAEFLKIDFPFILFHPARNGFHGIGDYSGTGYFWYPADFWPDADRKILRDVCDAMRRDPAARGMAGYVPAGFWGNPGQRIDGKWAGDLSAVLTRMRMLPKAEVWSLIEADLTARMAVDDSGIWLPRDEPGFLAPVEI